MRTIKLIVGHRQAFQAKYGDTGIGKIDQAIAALIGKDQERGIESSIVWLDDLATMKQRGATVVSPAPTAEECKSTIDSLFQTLSPDYLVILGSGDVIPHFEVDNPSYKADGDDDRKVPTDNPYGCSRPYSASDRHSYLVPDRVVGRIPDLPGKHEVEWLTDCLNGAAAWRPASNQVYGPDLLLCCQQWQGAGESCVKFLSRNVKRLMASPPVGDASAALRRRHGALFHMIKCHGAPLDGKFYGQQGGGYPEALASSSLLKRIKPGTVAGAMCCYGAALFDPDDPAAEVPGALPIPSVYLRQGAYGFVGSTTIAWVGIDSMQCADWVITLYLRGVTRGASLGRALLDAKQDLVKQVQQQGRAIDLAEEKALLQFCLLGDPSIHAVPSAPTESVTAAMMPGLRALALSGAGPAEERRVRRSFRFEAGEQLRERLPEISLGAQAQAQAERVFDAISREMPGFAFGAPLVARVVRSVKQPELVAAMSSRAPAAMVRTSPPLLRTETFQHYWIARRKDTNLIIDARMVKVETDPEGAVIRTQVLVST